MGRGWETENYLRYWLGGGDDDVQDETNVALVAFGLVATGDKDESGEPFKAYVINWETLQVFLSTWKKWRKVAIENRVLRDSMDWMQVQSA